MRICIITHHWVYNFGANLQALSTYRFLSKMGHEVWVLNYRFRDLEALYQRRVDHAQAEVHVRFCETHLRQSPVFYTEKELIAFCQEMSFDAILVGSDAVFRLSKKLDREDTRFPNPFWLAWAQSGLHPKPLTAALAASAMGTNYFSFPASVRRGISSAVCSMDGVSVRDRWTQLMLATLSWGKCRPSLCPDPVLVLNDVFSMPEECIKEAVASLKQYILLSVYRKTVSEAWVRELVTIAHDHGLQVFGLPLPEGELDFPLDKVIQLPLSPLEWYAWIQYSAGYIGVRFHPIACSMANGVPFLSFDTYGKARLRISSKTYDLCARTRTRSLCVPNRQIQRLNPRDAFDLLRSGVQDHARSYAIQAKRDFSDVIGNLLASRVNSAELEEE